MSQKNLGLTRLQIMTEGLGRAGRPDLLSNARLWLNLFLEKQYDDQDHEWLVKIINGRTLVQADTLPADYVRMKNISVTTSRLPVRLVELDEWDFRRRGVSVSGTPVIALIDQTLSLISFWPTPTISAPLDVYNYNYYFSPVLPEYADSAHDSEVPVWGLSTEILIHHIYINALRWVDDSRYAAEKDEVKAMLSDSKMNSRDLRAGSPKFKLGKSHRKRF